MDGLMSEKTIQNILLMVDMILYLNEEAMALHQGSEHSNGSPNQMDLEAPDWQRMSFMTTVSKSADGSESQDQVK